MGHPTTAYEALERALQINSADVKMWQDWGELLHRDENKDGAVTFLEEGIRMNPGASDLHYQLAAYLFELKQWNKGLVSLENALILEPAKHYILFNIFADLRAVPAIQSLIRQYTDDGN
jgi:tetratricopeptide (TPR) repeat protein